MVKDAKWLIDIRKNATQAGIFISGMTRRDYLANDMVRMAVERAIQNCGEAAWKLSKANPALAARLPRLESLISFRDMLVHEYEKISHMRVWQYLVGENLAGELHDTAEGLLKEIDPDAPPE